MTKTSILLWDEFYLSIKHEWRSCTICLSVAGSFQWRQHYVALSTLSHITSCHPLWLDIILLCVGHFLHLLIRWWPLRFPCLSWQLWAVHQWVSDTSSTYWSCFFCAYTQYWDCQVVWPLCLKAFSNLSTGFHNGCPKFPFSLAVSLSLSPRP